MSRARGILSVLSCAVALAVAPLASGTSVRIARPNVRLLCSEKSLGIQEARRYASWALDSLRFAGDPPFIRSQSDSFPLPNGVLAVTQTNRDAETTVTLGPQVTLPILAHELAHVRWRDTKTPEEAIRRSLSTLRAPNQRAHVLEALTSVQAGLRTSVYSSASKGYDTTLVAGFAGIRRRITVLPPSVNPAVFARSQLTNLVMHDPALFKTFAARRRLHASVMRTLAEATQATSRHAPRHWSVVDEISYTLAEEVAGYATADTVRADCQGYRQP